MSVFDIYLQNRNLMLMYTTLAIREEIISASIVHFIMIYILHNNHYLKFNENHYFILFNYSCLESSYLLVLIISVATD